MTPPPPDAASSYEFRVQGHLDMSWSTWFEGFTLTHQDDGTTTLSGSVRDQAELHGLLATVRDLGATLISVTALAVGGRDRAGVGSCTGTTVGSPARPAAGVSPGRPGP